MAEIVLTVDVSKALAVLRQYQQPVLGQKASAALREAALFGERTVVGFTPVKTGALRASIKSSQSGNLGWKIASPLHYAAAVEEGSKAHTIRPRGGKFLHFTVGGTEVFAREVRHPGTRGRRMFARAVPLITAQLPQIVARVLKA